MTTTLDFIFNEHGAGWGGLTTTRLKELLLSLTQTVEKPNDTANQRANSIKFRVIWHAVLGKLLRATSPPKGPSGLTAKI